MSDSGTVKASNLVRVIKNESGLTQKELSTRLGRGPRYVEGLIHRGFLQKIETILELCDASDCELLLRTKDGKVFKIENE
ncbi:MAG: hypothetical protein IJG82_09520 [Atopobiaceae bacterium]|nr:hypothetical protein [Atopobiaceae bacterium]